ncbi:MATE family efflux transporter [Tellurirhabdus rosea]|uniref:MATE family efflux transporter n=1 Tax=Tellurirhabdus rosea TaxID=2674997 RepID=UPI002251BCE7|nr:MATE family efflux transporter [Tellurirhabdus rosea]
MIQQLLNEIRVRKDTKSLLVLKNVVASVALKGISIVCQFVVVRITLQYLNVADYGVWLTLSSILTWLTLFDFGFTNGLRNKLTHYYADRNYESARQYISTAYAFLSAVTTVLLAVFLAGYSAVNWQTVFNAPATSSSTLPLVVLYTFVFFSIRLVLNLVAAILLAVHQAAYVEFINALTQVVLLGLLYVHTHFYKLDLLSAALLYSVVPVLLLFIFSIFVFNYTYAELKPSVHLVKRSLLKDLGTVGGKFFGMQLVGLVLFASQNFVIAHFFSPDDVTPFNLAYRYFSVVPIVFNLVIVPHWSFIAEAYHRHDVAKIRQVVGRLLTIWLLLFLVTVAMVVISDWVYALWLGKNVVTISLMMTLVLGLSTALTTWGGLFSLILSALGKITVPLITAVTVMFISIPLALYLAGLSSLGVAGVPLAFTLCLLPGAILQPYQCYLLLNRKARGLWAQ